MPTTKCTYEGEKDRNGEPHGVGTAYFDHGRYSGEWSSGAFHGYGELVLRSGVHYAGEFQDKKMHGQGRLKFSDGKLFEGDMRKGKMHGNGILLQSNGTYQGQFQDGKRHGKGTMWYIDNSIYVGDWKADAICGFGKCIQEDGIVYEGKWEGGEKSGVMHMTKPSGSVYREQWFDGRLAKSERVKSGIGKITKMLFSDEAKKHEEEQDKLRNVGEKPVPTGPDVRLPAGQHSAVQRNFNASGSGSATSPASPKGTRTKLPGGGGGMRPGTAPNAQRNRPGSAPSHVDPVMSVNGGGNAAAALAAQNRQLKVQLHQQQILMRQQQQQELLAEQQQQQRRGGSGNAAGGGRQRSGSMMMAESIEDGEDDNEDDEREIVNGVPVLQRVKSLKDMNLKKNSNNRDPGGEEESFEGSASPLARSRSMSQQQVMQARQQQLAQQQQQTQQRNELAMKASMNSYGPGRARAHTVGNQMRPMSAQPLSQQQQEAGSPLMRHGSRATLVPSPAQQSLKTHSELQATMSLADTNFRPRSSGGAGGVKSPERAESPLLNLDEAADLDDHEVEQVKSLVRHASMLRAPALPPGAPSSANGGEGIEQHQQIMSSSGEDVLSPQFTKKRSMKIIENKADEALARSMTNSSFVGGGASTTSSGIRGGTSPPNSRSTPQQHPTIMSPILVNQRESSVGGFSAEGSTILSPTAAGVSPGPSPIRQGSSGNGEYTLNFSLTSSMAGSPMGGNYSPQPAGMGFSVSSSGAAGANNSLASASNNSFAGGGGGEGPLSPGGGNGRPMSGRRANTSFLGQQQIIQQQASNISISSGDSSPAGTTPMGGTRPATTNNLSITSSSGGGAMGISPRQNSMQREGSTTTDTDSVASPTGGLKRPRSAARLLPDSAQSGPSNASITSDAPPLPPLPPAANNNSMSNTSMVGYSTCPPGDSQASTVAGGGGSNYGGESPSPKNNTGGVNSVPDFLMDDAADLNGSLGSESGAKAIQQAYSGENGSGDLTSPNTASTTPRQAGRPRRKSVRFTADLEVPTTEPQQA